MARARNVDRHRIGFVLAAMALLAGCAPQKHNSAENEFNAWAAQVERDRANGQGVDFTEPANVMARVVPVNAH